MLHQEYCNPKDSMQMGVARMTGYHAMKVISEMNELLIQNEKFLNPSINLRFYWALPDNRYHILSRAFFIRNEFVYTLLIGWDEYWEDIEYE